MWFFGLEDAGAKPETIIHVHLPVRSFSCIHIRLENAVTVIGIYVSRKMAEFILIPHVFQYYYILCVQRDITTLPHLMKEVLANQNDTDIPVMAAFRK